MSQEARSQAWRQYDEEDTRPYKDRIEPDEWTVKGEVLQTSAQADPQASHPIYNDAPGSVSGSDLDPRRQQRYGSEPTRLQRIEQTLIEQEREESKRRRPGRGR